MCAVDSTPWVTNTSVLFMTRSRNPASSLPGNKIPDAMYMGFVDSHLVDIRALVLASLVVIAAQCVVAFVNHNIWLWGCAASMALVSVMRLYFMIAHARNRPSVDMKAARKREIEYAFGVMSYIAALGLWAFVTFCVTEDGFSRLLATTLAICYAFGMWTRSFAISRGNNLQILVAFVPLSAAMFVAGGHYPAAIVFGLIPLGIYVKASSERLRANFLAVVAAQSQSAMLAKRLDMALNNMSHGLVMVDAKDRLVLANSQILHLFGLREDDVRVGADLRGILRKLVRNKVVARSEVDRVWQALFHNGRESDFVVAFETLDTRAIEITVHCMNGEGVVVVVQDVTERRNAALAIDRMARIDSVTELPNRRCFEEELSAMLRARGDAQLPANVLFLDLDDFKQVNDSLGHARGDKLLAAIARRLQALVRPSDLVARWGGDEFAILQRPIEDPQQTAELAEQMIREIRRPVFVDGYEVIVGASIGSASAPNDGVTPEAILSNADMALYAAKGEGRGNWRAFEKSMDAKI